MYFLRWILLFASVKLNSFANGQCSPCDSAYRAFKEDVVYVRFLHGGRFQWDRDVLQLYDRCMQRCNLIALLPHLHDSLPIMRRIVFEGIAQKTDHIDLLEGICMAHYADTVYVDDTSHEHYSETVKEQMLHILYLKKTKQRLPIANAYFRKGNSSPSLLNKELWHDGIFLKDLLALDSLTPPFPRTKIISFMLTTSTKEGFYEFKVKENRISDEMKKHFRQLKSGDKIFIEDTKVLVPDGTHRKLSPLAFYIH